MMCYLALYFIPSEITRQPRFEALDSGDASPYNKPIISQIRWGRVTAEMAIGQSL